MSLLFRILILLFVVPAAFYIVYWLPFSVVPVGGGRSLSMPVSLMAAGVAGWFVWTRMGEASQGALTSMLIGALVVGGIGFVGGFFGPTIFAPEANQGPLLGLFITGPGGFVVGAAGGLLHWLSRGRRERVG